MPHNDHPRSTFNTNRRDFMALCSAGAIFPGAVHSQTSRRGGLDVVVVGAGAAGIAAAHTLRELGVSYVHVEAASRVGGRAYTDISTFGVPYDHGAHWVQNEHSNPYFARAKASGHRFYRASAEFGVYADDRAATPEERAELWAAWDQAAEAMGTAAKGKRDVSPASVAPTDGDWTNTAWFGIGAWEMGKDMEDFSCLDWWNSADSNDWYCAAGYGALVAEHAAGLNISLDTPATKIRWGGKGVEVETARGTIKARAGILTVSTGVLAAEGITFDPPLPVEKQEAINAIPMGFYNHIALQFSEDIFGMGEDGLVLHRVGDDKQAFGALTNASGTGLAYCDVGGSFARELELAGDAVATDFVVGKLRSLIGGDVDKYLVKSAVSNWGEDPLVRGCYASASPGGFPMRAVLREPLADRIFFAGEACHEDLWATVGGADLTGVSAAKEIAKTL